MRYRRAWTAINQLMRQGYSWSGHEANVCFLNVGGNGFADVSSVSGFGLADDSRGLAVSDWDHDGDLDVWLTNRTAPMVRYLENVSSLTNSLRVTLEGTRSNRDAIGALATLVWDDGRMIARRVQAGSGYLSQSSKALHFAWVGEEAPSSLTVKWPSGASIVLPGGKGRRAVRVAETGAVVETVGGITQVMPVATKPHPSKVRFPSVTKPWFPEVRLPDGRVLGDSHDRPRLVQLWASWCAPCLKEKQDFVAASKRLQQVGLEVLPLSVDGEAPSELLDALEVMQRSLYDHSVPLGLPLSFLLDKDGRLLCCYGGRTSPDQVIADLASPQPRALPGEWLQQPPPIDPLIIATNYLAAGKVIPARGYLQKLADALDAGHPEASTWNAANLYALHATVLEGADHQTALEKALAVDPEHGIALRSLGLYHLGKREVALALPLLRKAAVVLPTDREVLFGLAQAHFAMGTLDQAIHALRALTQYHPDDKTATNNLAWFLATHPDNTLRNGAEALQLARLLPFETEPAYADTMAAALAETGAFGEAIQVLRSVIPKAEVPLKEKLLLRLKHYQKRQAWRER